MKSSGYKFSNKLLVSSLLGNFLDHYDTALYGFLCPLIAPLFLPMVDPSIAIMWGFGGGAVSFLSRPLGALFFGRLIYSHSIPKVLAMSLFGIALTTASIGCIPSYDTVGIWAPVFLLIARFFQGFFAEGENSLAGLYIFEILPVSAHRRFSSYYQVSSLLGILLASIISTGGFVNKDQYSWRIAFILGIAPAFVGILLRWIASQQTQKTTQKKELCKLLKQHKRQIIPIIMVSGFSYMTYVIPFVFLPSFVSIFLFPGEMGGGNTTKLLIFDLILFLFLTRQTIDKHPDHLMVQSASLLAISSIPLFFLLKIGGSGLLIVQLSIIIMGVIFAAPLQAWFFSRIPGPDRYSIIGFFSIVGKELWGRSTPFICWWLWNTTQKMYAPAIYITFVSILTVIVLLCFKRS